MDAVRFDEGTQAPQENKTQTNPFSITDAARFVEGAVTQKYTSRKTNVVFSHGHRSLGWGGGGIPQNDNQETNFRLQSRALFDLLGEGRLHTKQQQEISSVFSGGLAVRVFGETPIFGKSIFESRIGR